MEFLPQEKELLAHCTLCPRECGINRFDGPLGYCRSDAGINVSSVCIHKGEEPVISGTRGICNVFFPHCNLQCVYCQNHDISGNSTTFSAKEKSFEEVITLICETLNHTENIVGFVSPSHYVPQMLSIIRGIKKAGRNPIFVYNTNAYDHPETLKMLEGIIDVYLPDFKYAFPSLAKKYSQAENYPEIATDALKEMYRQKGSTLVLDDNGIAQSGIIVRHLVLPGAAENSIAVLKTISEEISHRLHISLMSQYFPTDLVSKHTQLNRNITKEEHDEVTEAFHQFGFYRGWKQDAESHAIFRPDFSNEQPFQS